MQFYSAYEPKSFMCTEKWAYTTMTAKYCY